MEFSDDEMHSNVDDDELMSDVDSDGNDDVVDDDAVDDPTSMDYANDVVGDTESRRHSPLSASSAINEYISSLDMNHKFLKNYQYLILQYFMSKYCKKRDMLLLWLSVGRGKTLLSIACGIAGLKTKMFKRVVILSPKAIQDEFKKNMELYCRLSKGNVEEYSKYFTMIAYNSWKANEELSHIKNLEHTLFIIDEAHLFMKSIIKVQLLPDELEDKHKLKNVGNAKKMYDRIKGLKHKKVLALTGTPSAKTPYETVPMFNLAYEDDLFTENYNEFNEKYLDMDRNQMKNVGELVKKLDGLIAYVPAVGGGVSSTNTVNVRATPLTIVNIEMSYEQYEQYLIDYEKELNELGFTNKRNVYGLMFGAKSSFHAKTFEDCVYWNHNLTNVDKEDRYVGNIVVDAKHCPKILRMYSDSEKVNGTCVFYFRFTSMYGIGAMEEMLKMKGFTRLKSGEDPFASEGKRYVVFSGDVGMNTRNKWKDMFNDKRNKYGKYIKYLLLSPSGSVGITLKNVRFLGIGSVEFNYSAIRQILGRVNRLNSHVDLPEQDRTLTNKIYVMTKNMRKFKEDEERIKKVCERAAPGSNEIAPSIEKIILYDSWKDDLINEDFKNRVLVKASITEEIWDKF